MALSHEERVEREFRFRVGRELQTVLDGLASIRPLRCKEHDTPLAECADEGYDCTVEGAEPYDLALLGDFVVIVDWMLPGKTEIEDDAIAAAFWRPGMTRSRRLGLMALAEENL